MSEPSTAIARAGAGCRFYGKSHIALRAAGVLMDQHGNECALIWNGFSPCRMEMQGQAPDEATCRIVREVGALLGEARQFQARLFRERGV
jgi:hypothetical protein